MLELSEFDLLALHSVARRIGGTCEARAVFSETIDTHQRPDNLCEIIRKHFFNAGEDMVTLEGIFEKEFNPDYSERCSIFFKSK